MEALLVVVRLVKLPVDGVVAPMAVPLIPVEVVLKLEDVTRKLLIPVSRVTPVRFVRLSRPEVPVIETAPVVTVRPFDAVKRLFEVIVPVPVVRMLPEVVAFPTSSIVSFVTPPERISRAIPYVGAVSSMMKALAVPSFVRVSEVVRPVPKVKSMFLPVVVVIVFPVLYVA